MISKRDGLSGFGLRANSSSKIFWSSGLIVGMAVSTSRVWDVVHADSRERVESRD